MFLSLFLSSFLLACNNQLPADRLPDVGLNSGQTRVDKGDTSSSDSAEEDPQPSGPIAYEEAGLLVDGLVALEFDQDDHRDQDEDGFTEDIDCNDHDPRTHPGATEFCDGIDTDCDGIVDPNSANDALTWYRDGDRDGF